MKNKSKNLKRHWEHVTESDAPRWFKVAYLAASIAITSTVLAARRLATKQTSKPAGMKG